MERERGVPLTFSLSPTFGPLTGRDRVTITASLPIFFGFPRCFFGTLDSPGMIVGRTNVSITVVTLPSSARWADLLLYLDDTDLTGDTESSVVVAPRAYKFNARPVAAVGNRTMVMFFPSLPFVIDGGFSNDTDGLIVRYNWTQSAGLPAQMSGVAGPQLLVTLPNTPGVYGFQLAVVDDNGYTDSTNVTISLFFARVLKFGIATSASGEALRGRGEKTGRPVIEDVLRAAAGVLLSAPSAMYRVRLNGEPYPFGAEQLAADRTATYGRALLQAPAPTPSPTPAGGLPAGAASVISFALVPPPGMRAEEFAAGLRGRYANTTGSLTAAMYFALPVPLVSLDADFLDRTENVAPVVHFATPPLKRYTYVPTAGNDSRAFQISVDASPSTDVDGYIRIWGWSGTITRNVSLLGPGLVPPPGPDGLQTTPLDLSDPQYNTPVLVIKDAFPDAVYNLVLVATDNDGASSAPRTFVVEVNRTRLGPVARVPAPDECLTLPNDALTLTAVASHTGPFPQALAYRWEYAWAPEAPALPPAGAKGSPPPPTLAAANASVRVSALFPAAGHRIVLTVTDLDGLSARVTTPVCVNKNPKMARIESLVVASAACVAAVIGLLALGSLGAAAASALGDVVVSSRRGNLLGVLHHAQLAAMYGELAVGPDIFAVVPSAIGFVTGQFRPPWLDGREYGPFVQNMDFGWITRWNEDPASEAWTALQGSLFWTAAVSVLAAAAHLVMHAFCSRVLKLDRPPDRIVFPRVFLAVALLAQAPLCLSAAKNLRSSIPYAAAIGALLVLLAGAVFPALCAWGLRRALGRGSVRYRSYRPPLLLHFGFRAYRKYLTEPARAYWRARAIAAVERRVERLGPAPPPRPLAAPDPPPRPVHHPELGPAFPYGGQPAEGPKPAPPAGLGVLEARRKGGAVVVGTIELPPLDTTYAQEVKAADAEREARERAEALKAVRQTLHQRKAFLRAAELRGAANDFGSAVSQMAGRVLHAYEAFWYLEAGAWLRPVLWRGEWYSVDPATPAAPLSPHSLSTPASPGPAPALPQKGPSPSPRGPAPEAAPAPQPPELAQQPGEFGATDAFDPRALYGLSPLYAGAVPWRGAPYKATADCVHRALVALSIGLLYDWPRAQAAVPLALALAQLLYVLIALPYRARFQNVAEAVGYGLQCALLAQLVQLGPDPEAMAGIDGGQRAALLLVAAFFLVALEALVTGFDPFLVTFSLVLRRGPALVAAGIAGVAAAALRPCVRKSRKSRRVYLAARATAFNLIQVEDDATSVHSFLSRRSTGLPGSSARGHSHSPHRSRPSSRRGSRSLSAHAALRRIDSEASLAASMTLSTKMGGWQHAAPGGAFSPIASRRSSRSQDVEAFSDAETLWNSHTAGSDLLSAIQAAAAGGRFGRLPVSHSGRGFAIPIGSSVPEEGEYVPPAEELPPPPEPDVDEGVVPPVTEDERWFVGSYVRPPSSLAPERPADAAFPSAAPARPDPAPAPPAPAPARPPSGRRRPGSRGASRGQPHADLNASFPPPAGGAGEWPPSADLPPRPGTVHGYRLPLFGRDGPALGGGLAGIGAPPPDSPGPGGLPPRPPSTPPMSGAAAALASAISRALGARPGSPQQRPRTGGSRPGSAAPATPPSGSARPEGGGEPSGRARRSSIRATGAPHHAGAHVALGHAHSRLPMVGNDSVMSLVPEARSILRAFAAPQVAEAAHAAPWRPRSPREYTGAAPGFLAPHPHRAPTPPSEGSDREGPPSAGPRAAAAMDDDSEAVRRSFFGGYEFGEPDPAALGGGASGEAPWAGLSLGEYRWPAAGPVVPAARRAAAAQAARPSTVAEGSRPPATAPAPRAGATLGEGGGARPTTSSGAVRPSQLLRQLQAQRGAPARLAF